MQLDAHTILVCLCAVQIWLAVQLFFFWFQDRKSVWLLWCAAPFLLGSLGLGLFVPRGQISDVLSIGLANLLLIWAFGLAWLTARSFGHRRALFWPIMVASLLWLACMQVPFFADSFIARTVFMSVVNALFCLAAAWELWRDRAEYLPSRSPAVAVILGYGLFMVARTAWAWGAASPLDGSPGGAVVVAFFSMAALVMMGSFAMMLVSLTKERGEARQRTHAHTDTLTGLPNRRAFERDAAAAILAAGRTSQPLALVLLDIDHFKSVNDRHGHDAGDRMLLAFAELTRGQLRSTDEIYRIGGEEFCILLPGASEADAWAVGERLRSRFAAFSLDHRRHIAATVSLGISTTATSGFDLSRLVADADRALYQAKALGRDQIVIAGRDAPREGEERAGSMPSAAMAAQT